MLKKFRNAMIKSIFEVLDLERSGVNSKLVKRILNFLMHPKPSGKPLPKSKKNSSSKDSKQEWDSSGTTRKSKQTKCPEILSDESSSDEDEKKNKEESSEDEEKGSEEEQPPKKDS